MATASMLVEDKTFTVGEVGKFFFDKSASWIRTRERQGILATQEGGPIGHRRASGRALNGRGRGQGAGDRVYTLDDIVEIAEALRTHGILDKRSFDLVTKRVDSQRLEVQVFRVRSED